LKPTETNRFNEFAMAKVFRARFLAALKSAALSIPKSIPPKWVVDCAHVGKGITALKYLSRYLYRGVISEKNIVSNQNGQVTFKYIESKTGNTRYRTLKGEDFLQLILQHVLPKGFRRVRDYGFVHSNAKKLLSLVQLILHVVIKSTRSDTPHPLPCSKKDISLYIETTGDTGLVHQPDKIVVRFTHTGQSLFVGGQFFRLTFYFLYVQ
jgi:hypothetical protein